MARLNYVELPVRDVATAKAFYERAFGWDMTEFGPTYAATLTGDTDIGLQGDASEATRHDRPPDLRLPRGAPLPVPRPQRQRDRLREAGLNRPAAQSPR
jgi:catechol 2,3-dioxygenase-like lactoylglutathione lyase family enzyme